jgi:hypothetical protein
MNRKTVLWMNCWRAVALNPWPELAGNKLAFGFVNVVVR